MRPLRSDLRRANVRLIMSGCYPKWIKDTDYPWAPTREQHEAAFVAYEQNWGTPIGFKVVAPSVAKDEQYRNWWARNLRMGASPGSGIALYRMNIEIDIRDILPAIRVPTLILHREGDRLIKVENSRYMATRIPDAKYVELKGGRSPSVVRRFRDRSRRDRGVFDRRATCRVDGQSPVNCIVC